MFPFPGTNRPSVGRSKGTTLAEVMVAIGILAVGLLGLVQVQAYIAQARNLSQNRVLATQRAGSELARLRELAKQDFSLDLTRTDVSIENDMTLDVTVEENWNGSSSLKGLTVTVSYPSGPREEGGQVRVWSLVRE